MQDTLVHTFEAPIEGAARGGAYVTVPFDVEAVYHKKRVKIYATIDGVPYRGSLVRMGSPAHILIIRKAIREQLGKGIGDTVTITVQEDTAPRVVQVPDDVQTAFEQHPEAASYYGSLSYTHQKEYVQWIEAAKRPATRERRLSRTIELLLAKQKER